MQIPLTSCLAVLLAAACSGDRPAAPKSPCSEQNQLVVAFASEDVVPSGPFTASHSLAYAGGMRYHDTTIARHVYVVFANYPARLHGYAVERPQSADQVAVVVSFKTNNVAVELPQQAALYADLALRGGDYAPGWMRSDESLQARYFVGGHSWGPVLSVRATGGGALTHVGEERVCGTLDLMSERGTHLTGSFNLPIERDVWSDGPVR